MRCARHWAVLFVVATFTAAMAQGGSPIRIGVLNDQSGVFADLAGPGSVTAAQMAADWDLDDQTRAWSQRFAQRNGGRTPLMVQAGGCRAVSHYLKALKEAGTDDATTVASHTS